MQPIDVKNKKALTHKAMLIRSYALVKEKNR